MASPDSGRFTMDAWIKHRYGACFRSLLAAFWLLPATGHALEISDRLSLSGFYSLDASLSLGGDTSLPARAGDITLEDGRVTLDYSLIGLQADFSLTDNLRVTAQVVSSRQTDENLKPTLEWGYLSYDFGEDLLLRGGRLKTPVLQGVELRHVGFSRLWARPLVPASGASGFDDYHGGEIVKRRRLGDYNLKIQGAYGEAEHTRTFIDNRDIKVLSTRVERDGSWVNLALMHARYDVHNLDRSRVLGRNAEVRLGSVEAEISRGNAILNFGYLHGLAEIIPDERLAYLSLGYRLNRAIPYLLLQYRTMDYPEVAVPPPSGAPPSAPRPPAPKDGEFTTRAISLGLRYDLDAAHAIKAQVERQFFHDATYRALEARDSATTLLSVTFEGVF